MSDVLVALLILLLTVLENPVFWYCVVAVVCAAIIAGGASGGIQVAGERISTALRESLAEGFQQLANAEEERQANAKQEAELAELLADEEEDDEWPLPPLPLSGKMPTNAGAGPSTPTN